MDQRSEIREKHRLPSVAAARTGFWGRLRAAVAALFRWARGRARRAEPLPDRLGAYTLVRKLGEGGMGVVYEAVHSLLGRSAAVKLLPPERSAELDVLRFEREVRVTSRLTHPNTIAVYDFGSTRDGSLYYAMEYVDGLDLQTLVERHGPQDPARVAHLLAQLAGALAEVHGAGLVHRDVKPANVMVCERGGVPDLLKVLDFGLVKTLGSDDGTALDAQRVIGTPFYLSPEAITTPEKLDARSDVYAVGAVGYFLLTGSPPFTGKTLVDVCARHLSEEPRPPSERHAGIAREFDALILRCLAKSPSDRPASAAALRSELLELAGGWSEGRAARWWSARSAAPAVCAA